LHLVVPIYGDPVQKIGADGKPLFDASKPVMYDPIIAYVHSTPLSVDAVDHYFGTLGPTWNTVMSGGYGIAAGPSNALRILQRVADNLGVWKNRDGTAGEGQMLLEEIRRLTMVSVPGAKGWIAIPLDVAVQQGHLNAEDKSEVENAIVFFIAAYAMLGRAVRREMVETAAELWGARISSLNSTEFTNSLTTSTATVNSGGNAPVIASEPSGDATAPAPVTRVSPPV
jgi:hypothetical protein